MDDPRPTADLAAIPSWDAVRKAITDSYYDTRTEGGTMETAANLAATRVQNLWSEVVIALARAAARPADGEAGLRAALHDAMAFGHTLATSPGPSLGHSGERYTDCPQPLCRRCSALAAKSSPEP